MSLDTLRRTSTMTTSGLAGQNSAGYEYKGQVGLPVIFRCKQYACASDALSAYISDYEGMPNRRRPNYERDLLNLFCPQFQPSAARTGRPSMGKVSHAKSQRELQLEKLVDQAYAQLHRLRESKKVEDTMNASSRLLERLEHDRLPSPTRSAILDTKRESPGSESVATEALLDARPIDFTAPYSQAPHSHSGTALLESLDLKYGPTHSNKSRLSSGPYYLKGMNDLMASMPTSDGRGLGPKSYSSESLTVDDMVNSARNERCQLASWVSTSPRKDSTLRDREVTLTSNQLSAMQRRLDENYPLTNRQKQQISKSRRKAQAKDVTSRSQSSAKLHSKQRAAKNTAQHGAHRDVITSDVNSRSRGGQQQQPQRDRSVISGATESSILSGHLLRGKQHRRIGNVKKLASTPIRAGTARSVPNTKQLRFQADEDNLGHGAGCRDVSAHSKSLDLSNIESLGDRPDMSFGRREIVSILKPQPSPTRERPASSRLSATTDDLLLADASGLDATPLRANRRSRSLPRRSTEESRQHESTLRSASISGRERGQHRSSQNAHQMNDDITTSLSSPLRGRSLARDFSTTSRDIDEARQTQYKQFLAALMRDIEDSTSCISTDTATATETQAAAPHDVTPTPMPAAAPQPPSVDGNGFLARVKALLTSPPPSVSQYLVGGGGAQNDSLSTDAVLDGDRSWEQVAAFKSPKHVNAEDKKVKTRFEKFMEECMTEAAQERTLSGGGAQQLGALETLKNMMFKMQSFSSTEQQQPTSEDDAQDNVSLDLDESVERLLSPDTKQLLSRSYAKQPGGPCLAKAMEHLNKLKGLVEQHASEDS